MLICVNRLSIVFTIKYSAPNQIIAHNINEANIVAIKYFTIFIYPLFYLIDVSTEETIDYQ